MYILTQLAMTVASVQAELRTPARGLSKLERVDSFVPSHTFLFSLLQKMNPHFLFSLTFTETNSCN